MISSLLDRLYRKFSRDPQGYLALRLDYAGTMTWTVDDGVLSTVVSGGPGVALSVDLSQFSLATLAVYLAMQPGYSVIPVQAGSISALTLVEGSGNPATNNGDHLVAYTSILYAFLDAFGSELRAALTAVLAMPAEMATTTADGEWLDLLGSYYGVPRNLGEVDGQYGPRIIAEILRPRCNNVAIELAVEVFTGQVTTVTDVVIYQDEPFYDGVPKFDGQYMFANVSVPHYGLFDVVVGYDILNGGNPSAFEAAVLDIVSRLRAAGTQLRTLALSGSALADSPRRPDDSLDSLTITTLQTYGSGYAFDGSITFAGSHTVQDTLSGSPGGS